MTPSARFTAGLLLTTAMVAGGFALLRTGVYGWTIFVLHPLFSGALTAWIFRPKTARGAAGAGALGVLVTTVALLLVGVEGGICIVMCLPIALPCGALGGWLLWDLQRGRRARRGLAMFLLLPPSILWDAKAPPPVFPVQTQLVVGATPAEVWKRVISFPDLPEPTELIFRAGVAYPIRAHLEGAGPGAVRYCEFSTGPFVEPIEVWDAPKLLRFRVTGNPAPMQEWNPFYKVVTRHLHGYLVSKRGQFRLTPLPEGTTLLEGTTWYQHGLWPAEYWRWWSDAIIHRIHLRVLNHIRVLAETGS
jgi:hypothetical protein